MDELKEVYNESWGISSPNLPGDVKGVKPAQETKDSLRYRGVFGAGGSPPNIYASSEARGGVYEQEEDQKEDQMISKNDVLKIVRKHKGHLSPSNELDKSGILHISFIEKEIEKLKES